jgi:hypothetical protein
LERQFDTQWREQVAPSWQQFHEETCQARERLAVLRAQASQGPLDLDPLLEWASVEGRVGGGEAEMLRLRREAVERFPDSKDARFLLGRQLANAGSDEGTLMIEDLLSAGDLGLEEAGAAVLRDYHWQKGDKAAADKWHERYAVAAQAMLAAREERNALLTTDTFLPHGLPDSELEPMVAQLRQIPGVKRAYLVRKATVHFQDTPMYAMGFTCSGALQRSSAEKIAETQQAIRDQVTFPGETLFLNVEKEYGEFETSFKRVEGSRIV